MSEPQWKYSDSTNKVVIRVWSDGRQESCLVEIPYIQDWVNAGNTILPADNL